MATATSSKTTKKVGKENAPPSRSTKNAEAEEEGQELGGEEDIPRKSSKPISKSHSSSKLVTTNGDEDDPKALRKKLAAVTEQRDRYRSQRETFSSQFEELTKSRSEGDTLLEKYKQKAELQAKAQNDIIATQTALTEKLQSKIKDLEKSLSNFNNDKDKDKVEKESGSGGLFDVVHSKSDSKEVKMLKDELIKLKNDNKVKDTEISELQKQYQVEVEYSKSLIGKQQLNASTNKSLGPSISTNVSTTPEEAEKDAASLALYEDLSLLQIRDVIIKPARIGKEELFSCLLSINGRSLSFKLKCYIELDKSEQKPKYNKIVHYTPDSESLRNESEEFINKIDYFSNDFVISRDQLGGFLLELRTKMGDDDDE